MKLTTWLLISSVGRIPSLITSTIGGDAFGSERYLTAVIIFVITLAISGAGIFAYHLIQKHHAQKKVQ